MRNPDLWQRLSEFTVGDDELPLSFIARLARDNNWSTAYAAAVYQEYLRFLYLAAIGDAPVTPSDDVDQVWHLHLAYSRSYWHELCDGVLGRPLHHGPTRGGRAEGRKFRDWYQHTLERYRIEFGAEPPGDIWPAPAVRFAHADAFRRIDTSRHFLLRKRDVYAFLTALAALLVATSARAEWSWSEGLLGTLIVIIALPVFLLLLLWLVDSSRKNGRGGRGDSGGGCGTSGCGGCGGCGG